MARGWESKSVEEQQSEFGNSAEKKASATPKSREHDNAIQALRLKRARVVQQLRDSQHPRFIELMQKELAFLDAELAKLESER